MKTPNVIGMSELEYIDLMLEELESDDQYKNGLLEDKK